MAGAASAATPSPASGPDAAAAARSVHLALAAAGAATLLAQATLLRELLAAFQGNELTLGLAFAAWLGLTAAASALGGRLARPPAAARRALGLVLVAAPALLWLALALVPLARPAGLLPGEEPGLLAGLRGALLALAPAAALAGLAFAFGAAALGSDRQQGVGESGSRILGWVALNAREQRSGTGPRAAASNPSLTPRLLASLFNSSSGSPDTAADAARPATRAYLAETAGAALAGAVFHFALAGRAPAAWVMALGGVACAAAGAAVLARGRWWAALGATAAVAALAVPVGPRLGAAVDRARAAGELVAARPSRYGLLTVTAQGQQRAFFHDGVLLFTTEDAVAAEERVHLPLLLHPAPRRVLLVGGGLGGGLAEVLKHRPAAVDYVELDPAVFALAAAHAGAAAAPLGDPRVRLHAGDGRDLLRRATARWDVILVALPEPQSAVLSRYYSRECYADARRALAPGGLLAVSVAAADAYLDGPALRRNAVLWRTLRAVFPAVGVAPGAQALVWAAAAPVPADPALLARRLAERGLDLTHVGPTWLESRLMPLRVDDHVAAVTAAAGRENHDLRPVAYFYGLTEALARTSPRAARLALRLADAPAAPWALPAAALGIALVVALGRRRRGAPGLAAFAAGAAGMALQLCVLLAFQAVRGHLYHAVGGLAAA
ncbi:MAG TPA: hypothetical protein VGQ83_18295, partial [Polyangia bacterium]